MTDFSYDLARALGLIERMLRLLPAGVVRDEALAFVREFGFFSEDKR